MLLYGVNAVILGRCLWGKEKIQAHNKRDVHTVIEAGVASIARQGKQTPNQTRNTKLGK
jgi:hypothetical protein